MQLSTPILKVLSKSSFSTAFSISLGTRDIGQLMMHLPQLMHGVVGLRLNSLSVINNKQDEPLVQAGVKDACANPIIGPPLTTFLVSSSLLLPRHTS